MLLDPSVFNLMGLGVSRKGHNPGILWKSLLIALSEVILNLARIKVLNELGVLDRHLKPIIKPKNCSKKFDKKNKEQHPEAKKRKERVQTFLELCYFGIELT